MLFRIKGLAIFLREQVICYRQGMIWQATVWMNGLPIVGWERLIAGKVAMQWKRLGLLPVMSVPHNERFGGIVEEEALAKYHRFAKRLLLNFYSFG